jgi:hypothetical protein
VGPFVVVTAADDSNGAVVDASDIGTHPLKLGRRRHRGGGSGRSGGCVLFSMSRASPARVLTPSSVRSPDSHARVPELVHDHALRDPLGEQQCRAGVPQIVDPDAAQRRCHEYTVEEMVHVARFDQRSLGRDEDGP